MRNIELPKACERRILMTPSSTVLDKLDDADVPTSGDANCLKGVTSRHNNVTKNVGFETSLFTY